MKYPSESDGDERPTHQFEALKAHLKHDKNGHVLSLVIHPNDTPEALWRYPVGQRFMIVAAPFEESGAATGDPEEQPRERTEGEKCLAHIHAVCREQSFMQYLEDVAHAAKVMSHDDAVRVVKDLLDLPSTALVKESKAAQEAWRKLYADYRFYTD